jgi:molybdopterin-guanine dinucleotide biosynthesis protein A
MSQMSAPLPLYILAGGHSSRFGSDKAVALFNGLPLIVHVAEQFRPWANPITVVTERPGKYEHLGFRTIADDQPHLGPVGGLLTALNDCQTQWLLLAACDAFILDPAAIDRLICEPRIDCQAIAFKGEHWEPLPALFNKSILPAADQHVEHGSRSLWRLIEQASHRAISLPHGPVVCQINTPEELQKVAAAHRT